MSEFSPSRIAIVGGGPGGALMAAHLLRGRPRNLAVTIIETRAELGRGLAYATDNPSHLLNVRAANMSAFADDPGSLRGLAVDPARRSGGGRPRIPLRLARSLRPLPRKLDSGASRRAGGAPGFYGRWSSSEIGGAANPASRADSAPYPAQERSSPRQKLLGCSFSPGRSCSGADRPCFWRLPCPRCFANTGPSRPRSEN